MKIAVTDANIFIDLIKLDLLDFLFSIGLEVHTTREIVDQLNEDQSQSLNKVFRAGHLHVYYFSSETFEEMINMNAPRSLELADKSVVWLSIRLNAIALTGDGPLRKFCETKNLQVRGIIWVFEEFVRQKLLKPDLAAEKMTDLLSFNGRLPKDLCLNKIRMWSSKK